MPDLYAQTLGQIIVEHGRSVCEEPRKLKALLADYLGKHPGQHEQPINVLLLALENRVVQDLLVSDALPADMVQRRIAERLKSTLGVTEQAAAWGVAVWSSVMMPQPAPVTAALALSAVSSVSAVKPNTAPLAGPNQETEGAASVGQFASLTMAATGFVRSAVTAPFWRRPLGMFLGGGIAGVLVTTALIYSFRAPTPASAPPTPVASRAETPPPPPDTWKVIFRSADPSIWNDDIKRRPDQFGMALELVPGDIRYLRMTNLAIKDFFIIEMTKERLGKQSDDGRYGWNGTNAVGWNARQLGIYYRIWPPGADGDVCVTVGPHFRGWGFGPLFNVDTEQGYSWEGKPIRKTVFEIAVTAQQLTVAEAKRLLKAGVPRQSPPTASGSE